MSEQELDALQALAERRTPITDALIQKVMAEHKGVSARAQADYYEAVHQEIAPLCRQFEVEIAQLKADMQSLRRTRRADTGKSAEAWPSFYDYTHKPISDEPCPNCKGEEAYPAICALCYGCGKLTALGKSHRDGYSRATKSGKEGGE